MDKEYEKERFASLSIKSSVVKKFKRFRKKYSKSLSMTLFDMVEFFEVNGVSPNERLGETISSLKYQMRKRFNAVISIIRDIEKNQTKPTTAMLQTLFEQNFDDEEVDSDFEDDFDFIEKESMDSEEKEEWFEETTIPKIRYERLEEKMNLVKEDFGYVLDHIKEVKNSFGKDYLKLELSMEEIEKYKRTLKNL